MQDFVKLYVDGNTGDFLVNKGFDPVSIKQIFEGPEKQNYRLKG